MTEQFMSSRQKNHNSTLSCPFKVGYAATSCFNSNTAEVKKRKRSPSADIFAADEDERRRPKRRNFLTCTACQKLNVWCDFTSSQLTDKNGRPTCTNCHVGESFCKAEHQTDEEARFSVMDWLNTSDMCGPHWKDETWEQNPEQSTGNDAGQVLIARRLQKLKI